MMVERIEESHQSLNVCTTLTADGRNCSRCNKCLRTQLTLDLTGHLEAYSRALTWTSIDAFAGHTSMR